MSEERSAINVYTCPSCGWKAVTKNRDEGVTPMFIRCQGERCDRMTFPGATSAMYRVPQDLEPTHEWYRPTTAGERKRMGDDPGTIERVKKGGLLLRKLVS